MADGDNLTAAEQVAHDAAAKSKQRRKRRPSAIGPVAKPKFKEMVEEAISVTQDSGGSSLQAIKKYLAANYGLDSHNAYIRNAIKKGVTRGELIQVKGSGASGSFKLSSASAAKPAKTSRQKDSDKVRQEKDAKSAREAQRIARNATKARKERQAKRGTQEKQKKLKSKPSKGTKKIKTHKKVEKKKKTAKKTPKAKKGSRK